MMIMWWLWRLLVENEQWSGRLLASETNAQNICHAADLYFMANIRTEEDSWVYGYDSQEENARKFSL